MATVDSESSEAVMPSGSVKSGPGTILLISPVHNEADHINAVAEAVLAQTRLPDRWVVIDDDSTDGTLERLQHLESRIPFMEVLSATHGTVVDGSDRLAAASVELTYNQALEWSDWRSYSFIGKLDGDALLPEEFIELMLRRFGEEPALGIAGGALFERRGERWQEVVTPSDQATGMARVYRRDCLEAIGGIRNRLGSDAIAVALAQINGYEARTFKDLGVRHLRAMGSAQGILRGWAREGRYQYVVRYGAGWAALRSLKLAITARPRLIGGLAFLCGYVNATLQRSERVEEEGFVAHMRREQHRRIKAKLGLNQILRGQHERSR